MATETRNAGYYNEHYQQQNYFGYQNWIYSPYVSSLIAFCGLRKGASVLDVGCGQGFFSYLFSKHGMKVHGIDLSETGVRTAENLYGQFGITFAVSDIQMATFPEQFDCIFVRSCSLYNTDDFPLRFDITDKLLKHLKPGGTFIFVYNSNFSRKASPKWRYHSFEDTHRHFRRYPDAQVFFLSKITTYIMRQYSISSLVTPAEHFLKQSVRQGWGACLHSQKIVTVRFVGAAGRVVPSLASGWG
jgi:SAM-dependent methyltransferase